MAARSGQALACVFIVIGILATFRGLLATVRGGLGSGLWRVVLGWFLLSAAEGTQRAAGVRRSLHGVSVGEDVTVLLEPMARHDVDCLPVVDGGKAVGVVNRSDVIGCLQTLRELGV